MKICKAIKVCRKLAKAALPEAAPARSATLRAAKVLLDRFNDELAARSESTSIQQAAAAIAQGRARSSTAQSLDLLAEAAAQYLMVRADAAKKDETSAVAIVRMLAWNIRAVRPALRQSRRVRAGMAAAGLQVA